jgi:hypothetical protein
MQNASIQVDRLKQSQSRRNVEPEFSTGFFAKKKHASRNPMPESNSGFVLSRTAAAVMLVGSALLSPAAQSHAATTTVHVASAYGAEVNVGSAVELGKLAPAVLPTCSTNPKDLVTATAASVSDAPLIGTGALTSTASGTANSATGESDVLGVNLLGGVISATEIKSVSNITYSGGKFQFSSAGTVFDNLAILGLPVGANPAPNTTIDLPGIGTVVLNEQLTNTYSSEAKFTVNAIHVHVTLPNLLGYKLGTEIIVADAATEVQVVKGPSAVGGFSQSPSLSSKLVSSGPLVQVIIPCDGTGGAVDTDSVASANLPGVLITGAVSASGSAAVNASGTYSQTSTSVAGLNLLSGLVNVTAIMGTAKATTADGINFDFTGGSTFVGLAVSGHPEITDEVAANTKISIANLGTLYLNRVQKSSNQIRVTPVELDVLQSNTLGLSVGAVITIGVSDAQLHSATVP